MARTVVAYLTQRLGSFRSQRCISKNPRRAGALILLNCGRLIPCSDRSSIATDAVVQPDGDHIHVLVHPITEKSDTGRCDEARACEGVVVMPIQRRECFLEEVPRATLLAKEASPTDEFLRLRTSVGDLIARVDTMLQDNIYKDHPDLDGIKR